MPYEYEFHGRDGVEFGSTPLEVLPADGWTLLSISGKMAASWVHADWVIMGGVAQNFRRWDDIRQALAERGVVFEGDPTITSYANRYKPISRGCIIKGFCSKD